MATAEWGLVCAASLLALIYGAASLALVHRCTAHPAPPMAAGPGGDAVQFYSRSPLIRLTATYLPAAGARGAVVLVHGLGMHRGQTLAGAAGGLSAELRAAGLSVLALDLRGHGGSDPARLGFGRTERLDVLGAVDWLLERGYPPGRIAVAGASMGGAAAIAAAAEEPAIGAVVSDSAFAHFGAMLWRTLPGLLPLGLGVVFLPGLVLGGWLLLGANLYQFSPALLATRLRQRPLLVIHAADDRCVPVAHASHLAAHAGTELWITPTGGHLGSVLSQPIAYRHRVARFLVDALACPRKAHDTVPATPPPALFDPEEAQGA